jgi:hypothetical protein
MPILLPHNDGVFVGALQPLILYAFIVGAHQVKSSTMGRRYAESQAQKAAPADWGQFLSVLILSATIRRVMDSCQRLSFVYCSGVSLR